MKEVSESGTGFRLHRGESGVSKFIVFAFSYYSFPLTATIGHASSLVLTQSLCNSQPCLNPRRRCQTPNPQANMIHPKKTRHKCDAPNAQATSIHPRKKSHICRLTLRRNTRLICVRAHLPPTRSESCQAPAAPCLGLVESRASLECPHT